MAGHETLRSIPNLLAPSRPKKSPSPRLTPRRSSAGRRSSEGRFPLGRLPMMGGGDSSHGNENESENLHHHQLVVNSVSKSDPSSPNSNNDSKPLISRIQGGNNNRSSIVTSPLESSAKKKERRQLLRQQKLQDNGPSSPTSPSPASFGLEGLSSLSPSSKSDDAAFAMEAATDEDCVPLTPRNLVMEVVGDDHYQCTLTPPVSALTPLIVSAKRAGSIGRAHGATKRRRPLHADHDDSSSSSDEDDTMKLPEGLSPTQRAQEYWKRCYGDLEAPQQEQVLLARYESWSAKRAAPTKSCMSHSKPKRSAQTHAQILLPTEPALLRSPPLPGARKGSPQGFSTPRSSPDEPLPHKCSHAKSVQFGVTQAAEYDLGAPAAKFTPLPAEIARERFPLTNKKEEEGEEEEIAETKVNSAMLAEWESDFDSFVDHSEESSRSSRKRHSSKKDRTHRRHSKSKGISSTRSERRRSSAFCSPGQAKVLYDPASEGASSSTTDVTTPNKQSTAVVLNDMADLSMKSPVQMNQHETQQDSSGHQGLSQESSVMSPVVARNLAVESPTDIVIGEATKDTVQPITVISHESPAANQLPKKRKKVVPLVLVENGWDEFVKNPTSLNGDVRLDPVTVFSNLTRAPPQLWLEPREENLANIPQSLESCASTWHASVSEPFQASLNDLTTKVCTMNVAGDMSLPSIDDVSADIGESWKRKAHFEWKRLEKEFCRDLKKQIDDATNSTTKLTNLVDFLDVPCEASRGPTQKHSEEVEKELFELMNAIEVEEKAKKAMERRQRASNLQSCALAAPFAILSSLAMSYLCPFDVDVSHQGQEAVFNHLLLPGLETRVTLDGSMATSICQYSEDNNEVARHHDVLSKFYNSMLCSSSSTGSAWKLHESLHQLIPSGGDINDELLQLAVIVGRVDLTALSVQDIAALHEVTVVEIVEEGQPIVVVRIKLPRNTNVNVLYRRGDLASLFWIPSKVFVERDGQPLLGLIIPINHHMHWSAGGILGHICRQVNQL